MSNQKSSTPLAGNVSLGEVLKASLETKSGWIVSGIENATYKAQCGKGVFGKPKTYSAS